jgi:hypothetical protein
MRELLTPDEEDMFHAVQVLVSEEMAKDFKNLDYGFDICNVSQGNIAIYGDPRVTGSSQPTTQDGRTLCSSRV